MNDSGRIPRLQDRYGIPPTKDSWGFRWHEFDERFDAVKHPNEANRFGWVVEFDPYDPEERAGQAHRAGAHGPRRRDAVGWRPTAASSTTWETTTTARGSSTSTSSCPHARGSRAGAMPRTARPRRGHAVRRAVQRRRQGEWIELVHGRNGLTPENGFTSQAEVVIDARTAGDVAGATYMDRPEWIAVNPRNRDVYVTPFQQHLTGEGPADRPQGPGGGGAREPAGAEPDGSHRAVARGGRRSHRDALRVGRVPAGRRPAEHEIR